MLVLSRKTNEKVVIQGDIEVVVLKVAGDRVRIGVNAPQEVSIVREELIDRDARRIKGEIPSDAGEWRQIPSHASSHAQCKI